MKIKLVYCVLAVLAGSLSTLCAQSGPGYDLHWNTLDAGGDACAGGTFVITGTFGQPDASQAAAGGFTLAGGFWPGVSTETGPQLALFVSAGSVVISWPASASGFRLQYCADLARPQWVNSSSPSFTLGQDKVVVEATQTQRFYRLAKP